MWGLAAFGVTLNPEQIPRPGAAAVASWRPDADGNLGRLIASVRFTDRGCTARVELASVDTSHPLARCRGAGNAVVISLRGGETITLQGSGAGRWPTAESVMGDLLELWRDREHRHGRRAKMWGEFEARAS